MEDGGGEIDLKAANVVLKREKVQVVSIVFDCFRLWIMCTHKGSDGVDEAELGVDELK